MCTFEAVFSGLCLQPERRPFCQPVLTVALRPGLSALQAELHQRIQGSKSSMDSQGSGSSSSSSSSSEAWANRGLSPDPSSPPRRDASPGIDYQYSETSLSPPLHPSKRPASNPPPISNQATKGGFFSDCTVTVLAVPSTPF